MAYALLLEAAIYRTLTWEKMIKAILDAGIVTGVVFILVGAGQVFSWTISFLRIPQAVMPSIIGTDPTQLQLIITVVIAYFVACMFVDPIVAIYVLSPIFQPYVEMTGIDPVFLGTPDCSSGSYRIGNPSIRMRYIHRTADLPTAVS